MKQIENKNISFWQLLTVYKIEIPIIQRDYAQGREDDKTQNIRNHFLDNLIGSLSENHPLELDFVYGEVKNGGIFQPLDGQQRLTTLYLLHWYIAYRTEMYEEKTKIFKKFTYETRISSRDFCIALATNYSLGDGKNIKEKIIDSAWFFRSWKKDPTIKAMLVMLVSIEEKLKDKNKNDDELSKYWEKLTTDNPLITFHFLELNKIGLTDDLYIKMNARGKELTYFENFKAKFEQHLSSVCKEKLQDFSNNIDKVWCDYFWKYATEDKKFLIDDYIMNYITFISEMLFYKNKNNKNEEFKIKSIDDLIEVYKDKEDIEFLCNSFDYISKENDDSENPTRTFCADLFYEQGYEKGKVAVALFTNKYDLLKCVIKEDNKLNIQEKILLFLAIYYKVNIDENNNENLSNLLRVVRNLTQRIRQLKGGDTIYTGNLSFKNIRPILDIFIGNMEIGIYEAIKSKEIFLANSGITQLSLDKEKNKGSIIQKDANIKEYIFKLEDHKFIKGDTHNFITKEATTEKAESITNAIYAIFSNTKNDKKNSLIIRSMLAVDDYKLEIGWSNLGYKYYFGKEDDWEIILTSNEEYIQQFFEEYLSKYNENNNSLVSIIKNYLQSNPNKDWRYYFVKYKNMTSQIGVDLISNDSNTYAWRDGYSIEKMGGKSLGAYHVNPYLYTVYNILVNDLQKSFNLELESVKNSNLSYLLGYDEKIKIYCKEEGCKIKINEDSCVDFDNFFKIQSFKKESKDNNEIVYLLKINDNTDRIKFLVDLLQKFHENAKSDTIIN